MHLFIVLFLYCPNVASMPCHPPDQFLFSKADLLETCLRVSGTGVPLITVRYIKANTFSFTFVTVLNDLVFQNQAILTITTIDEHFDCFTALASHHTAKVIIAYKTHSWQNISHLCGSETDGSFCQQ